MKISIVKEREWLVGKHPKCLLMFYEYISSCQHKGFCPAGNTWQCLKTSLILMTGDVLLLSYGLKPEILLNILRSIGRSTEVYLGQH